MRATVRPGTGSMRSSKYSMRAEVRCTHARSAFGIRIRAAKASAISTLAPEKCGRDVAIAALPAGPPDPLSRGLVEQGDAVPQHVAGRRADQQRALPDPERRGDAEADQV